jgi:hypothetical protein
LCRRSTPDAEEEETDSIGGHGRCGGARSTVSDSISEKNADTQIWSLERTENEPYQEPPDPVLDTVSQLVSSESREWTGSPTELAEAVNTGMAANALTKYLNVKSGRLLDEYHVRYENRAKHSGRQVKLTYMVIGNVEYEVID